MAVHAGRVAYQTAWDWQRALVADRHAARAGDTLLLLEHPAVYTRGKRTDPDHVRWDAATRRAHGVDLVDVDRGGDVTYHGPGQLVGYPIIKLASIRAVVDYVRALEGVLIDALADFGVAAARVDGYTGVWVGDEKIAAIGVRVASGGITSHGFALNVAPDLAHFTGIVPCGITDRGVCSLASLGVDVSMDEVATAVEQTFAARFNARLERQSRAIHERRYPAVFADVPHASAVPA
ncbi:MAG: lipoyl(octanoyl) transferase LipB [Nitriliruptoraceae bacterium]